MIVTCRHLEIVETDFYFSDGYQNQSQAISTSTFASTSTRHLVSLQSEIKSYLERDIRTDVPTGMTPRKKEWPKDSLLSVVDLDGDRSQVRNVLVMEKRRAVSLEEKFGTLREVVVEEVEQEDEGEEMLKIKPLVNLKLVLGELDPNQFRRKGVTGSS